MFSQLLNLSSVQNLVPYMEKIVPPVSIQNQLVYTYGSVLKKDLKKILRHYVV